jgi:hypothetical protein
LFQFIILSAYCLIAAAVIAVTLLEGWTNHDRWTLHRIAGLVACVFWPLTALVFILHNIVASQTARRPPEFLTGVAAR